MRLLVLTLVLVAFVVAFAGCNDDDGVTFRTTSPDWRSRPTLNNIWPNADQTSWTYDYVWLESEEWSPAYYPTEDDVPPLPAWADFLGYLGIEFTADSLVTTKAIFRMKFDGQTTSGPGVTAQNLEESFQDENTGAIVVLDAAAQDREFIRRLYLARPDLKATLERLVEATPALQPFAPFYAPDESPAASVLKPLYVHGGVWEKTSEWIGTYGVLDRLLAWKFLTANLNPGTEFSHQLIPSMADDVFLHCRVLRRFEFSTEIGEFQNAIACLYVLDYGISIALNTEGQRLGYTRNFGYGVVIYAPTVGPVYSHERSVGSEGDPIGREELEIRLIASSTLDD
jgi:hypothetical protein